MKTVRLHPGQIHTSRQRAGTLLIAINGVLRLTYRDPSLDWLIDSPPRVCVDLNDGEAHVISCDTWVEVDALREPAIVGLLKKRDSIDISIEKLSAWLKEKTRAAFAKA